MKGYRRKPIVQIEPAPAENMGNLTVDPRCPDLYPDCGSSNSSFSYGLPTPTSTADFSAATSRRQSTASEVHCNESAIARLPNFSTEGNNTPLGTPSPFRPVFHSDPFSSASQGYDPDTSPLGDHDRGVTGLSTANGVCFQDPFSAHASYPYATATSELDTNIRQATYQDRCSTIASRSMGRTSMNWPQTFHESFGESYDQNESTPITQAFGFGTSSLTDSDLYLEYGTVIQSATEEGSPQTVSPQETFFGPDLNFLVPTTPERQPLAAPFQTPMINSEPQAWEPTAEDYLSSGSSFSVGDSPMRRVPGTQERRQTIAALGPRRARVWSRGSKRKRTRSVEVANGIRLHRGEDISSDSKKHRCEVCNNMPFYRPEHFKRHKESDNHNKRLRELGLPPEGRGEVKFRCVVPECETAVTRHDNLKPHYQKTHLYSWYLRDKDGSVLKDKDGRNVKAKKRNIYVSKKWARDLGLEEYDIRPKDEEDEEDESCREPKGEDEEDESCKNLKVECSSDVDE
ncbi:MAG: hypothetical protein Q9184_004295 [Pyrenodesmia sp. 2 TL-2023]